jgi:transposase
MYDWEPRVLLRHYLEQGLSKTAIAARIGISRRCIYKWIASGDLDRDLEAGGVCYPPRPTRLDPCHALIQQRLETYLELTALRLFDEVRAAGYPGSLTQLKVFVRRVGPVPAPEPVIRFETAPGLQAQVDFATCQLPWGRRFALMVVLGCSRLL